MNWRHRWKNCRAEESKEHVSVNPDSCGFLSAVIARTHKRLCALVSLGAGTLLGVAVFGITPECLETLRWWQFVAAAATGYGFFAVIRKYVFHVCPACAAS